MIKQTMAALLMSTSMAAATDYSVSIKGVSAEYGMLETNGIQLSLDAKEKGYEAGIQINKIGDLNDVENVAGAEAVVEDNSVKVYFGGNIHDNIVVGGEIERLDIEGAFADQYGSIAAAAVVEADDTKANAYIKAQTADGKTYAKINTNADYEFGTDLSITENASLTFTYAYEEYDADFYGIATDGYYVHAEEDVVEDLEKEVFSVGFKLKF